MKKITLYLAVILTLNCCAQSTTKTNPFIEEVKVEKSDNHQRIEGTKLFAEIPSEYKFIEQLGRYQKNEKQFIQFVEASTSFKVGKNNISREALGDGVVFFEEIRFNSFEGIFAEGENPHTNENDLILLFGDDEFMTMVVGKTETDKPENRKELIEILKSIFYDKGFILDELELANFTFDKSISEFKHSMTATNMFMFAENGKEDAQNPFANSMLFGNLPKMNKDELKSYTEDMVSRHKASGIALDNDELKEIKIGEYTAIILDTKTKFQGKRGLVYQAVISDENQSMMFIGSGYGEIEDLRDKYIKTVETIKMK